MLLSHMIYDKVKSATQLSIGDIAYVQMSNEYIQVVIVDVDPQYFGHGVHHDYMIKDTSPTSKGGGGVNYNELWVESPIHSTVEELTNS